MKKQFIIITVISFLNIVSLGQTKNITINDSKLDRLSFGMTIKSAERLLGKDYVKTTKKGHVCNYYKG